MSGPLEHSPADVVRYLMRDLGLGVLPSSGGPWPVFVGNEPDNPDNCLTLYDTAPTLGGRIQATGEYVEKHGIQIRLRAKNHVDGYQKSREITEALDTLAYRDTVTINGASYLVHALHRTSGIIEVGFDSPVSKRLLFTVNYLVTLRMEA